MIKGVFVLSNQCFCHFMRASIPHKELVQVPCFILPILSFLWVFLKGNTACHT